MKMYIYNVLIYVPKIINKAIASKLDEIDLVQNFEDKILVNSKSRGLLLLNFNENKIEEVIDNNFYTQIIQLKNNKNNYINYTIGDTIFIRSFISDSIYNFFITKNQKKLINEKIYENYLQLKHTDWLLYLNMLLILIFCIGIFYVYKKNRFINKYKINAITNNQNERIIKTFIENLSIIEKLIISSIYKDNKQGHYTSTNKINKILGLDKKDAKLQNNLRGEILKSINLKFKTFYSINENLVDRQKSNIDKRQVEYLINNTFIKKINEKLFE